MSTTNYAVVRNIVLFILLAVSALSCKESTPTPAIDIEQPFEETKEAYEIVCPIAIGAQFTGGIKAWKTYVNENLQKPKIHVEGKVYLSFSVSAKGEISDVEIMRGIQPKADQLAIDLLKKSPKWRPATQQGVPVKTSMMIMIPFSSNS